MRRIATALAVAAGLLLTAAAPSADELDGPALLARAARSETEGDAAAALADLDAAVAWYAAEQNTAGERIAREARGRWHARHGSAADAVAEWTAALPLADAAVDRTAPVRVRLLLAGLHLDQGRPADALVWTDAALIAAAQPGGFPLAGRASLDHLRTVAALDGGDRSLLGALQHADRRLAHAGSYEGASSLPGLLFVAAAEPLSAGDPELAATGLALVVRAADILGEPGQLPPILTALGYAALEAGDLDGARAALERGLTLDDGRSVALLASLGEVERREGWLDEALQRLDEAIALARDQREAGEVGVLTGRRGDVLAQLGQGEEARREWSRAARQLDDSGERVEWIRLHVRLAGAAARDRRWEEAEDHALRSLGRNRNTHGHTGAQVSYADPRLAAEALLVMAAMHAARDRLDAARKALGQADAIRERQRVNDGWGRQAAARVNLELLAGDLDAAAEALEGRPPALAGDPSLAQAEAALSRARGEDEAAERHLREALTTAGDRPPPWDAHPPLLPAVDVARDALVELLAEQGRAEDLVDRVLAEGWLPGEEGAIAGAFARRPSPGSPVLCVVLTADGGFTALAAEGISAVVPLEPGPAELRAAAATLADVPAANARPRQLENWHDAGALLYRALVAPHAAALDDLDADSLVFALDPALAGLVEAALREGDGYLVERFELSRAPAGGAAAPPYDGKPKLKEAELHDGLSAGPSPALQILRDKVRVEVDREQLAALAHPADPPSPILHLASDLRVHPLAPARSQLRVGEAAADAGAVARWNARSRWITLETPAGPATPPSTRALAGAFVAAGTPHVLLLPAGDGTTSLVKALLKGADRHPLPSALARAQRSRIAADAPAAGWAGVVVVGW